MQTSTTGELAFATGQGVPLGVHQRDVVSPNNLLDVEIKFNLRLHTTSQFLSQRIAFPYVARLIQKNCFRIVDAKY
jgi:hypothetical protein